MQDLPGVGGRHLEHAGNLVVRVVEDFLEQKHRALFGRQRFEQDQECQRDRFVALQHRVRPPVKRGEHWFRQPRADVLFASRSRRLQPVKTQPRHDGGQPRLRRTKLAGLRVRASDPGVLNDVFRIARAAEHAIGNGKEQRTVLFELLGRDHFRTVMRLERSTQGHRARSDTTGSTRAPPSLSHSRAADGSM